MPNAYREYLKDRDAQDHVVGLESHGYDPFLPRHFADWVYRYVTEASLVDVDETTPDFVTVEYTPALTRRDERVMVRVANKCGYHLVTVDEARREMKFARKCD